MTAEERYASFRELMAALDYIVDDEEYVAELVEDYADEYLDEDLGTGLFVNIGEGDRGEELSLRAKLSFYTHDNVDMEVLETPVSVTDFHTYLDVFDLRVARKRTLLDLPPPVEEADFLSEDPPPPIVEVLARLFGTTQQELVSELGDDWQPVRCEGMGSQSQPDRYLLWDARLVVGIDDMYVHVFLPTEAPQDVDSSDVVAWFELGESETVGLGTFARVLKGASAERHGRGPAE